MTKEELEKAMWEAFLLLANTNEWNLTSPEKRLVCIIACFCGMACKEINLEKFSVKAINTLGSLATRAITDIKKASTPSSATPTTLN